jgi:hypothetical protein
MKRIRPLNRPKISMRTAAAIISIALLATTGLSHAQSPLPPNQNQSNAGLPPANSGSDNAATVLLLGDSLSLCGFGKRLDEHFRQTPEVAKATFTYVTCGTNPLSWLKERPYTSVKTHCGFWSIESVPGSQPKELEDVYGMRRGSTPKAHPVPKLEDLLVQIRPDVLIMQTGGNLFDLFQDRKTVRPDRDATALKKYLAPFISKAIAPSSSLRKIYWVASPTSGRVSKTIQDFVVEQVRTHLGALGTVIDSRSLISYPYHHMEPDHEHFVGADMDLWADKVFEIIKTDLSAQPLASLKPLSQMVPAPTSSPAEAGPLPGKPASPALQVSARLVFKSKPMQVEEFLPYQESMISFVYDVREVLDGEYSENQILVMHPAFIGLRKQSLRKYRIGRTYRLQLRELEGTPWSTVKRRDDSGRIDLEPYIQVGDEAKYPETAR